MAIPSLKRLEDCAEYSKVVEPFLQQLYELPGKAIDAISNRDSLLDLYTDTNPLVSGFAFSIFLGGVFLVVSEINRNYSQVDRMWSLLPTIYNAHFAFWAHLNDLPTQRLNLVLLFSTFWSARLTFNYWRKGGYTVGSEDYRWEIVRAKVPAAAFFLLNVTFISFIQSILLYALAAPTYIILLATQFEPEISVADLGFAGVQLGLVVSEWFSDQQQWDYQTAKKEYQRTAKIPRGCGISQEDLDRGFITTGLWAYCRHPNFAAEQAIWFVLYQWGCYASKSLYNWAGSGALFLIMLFQGSTWLTEVITSGKYPEYKDYQKQIGAHIPSVRPYQAPASTSKVRRENPKQK
ncbi:Uu.00g058980.m01.CDS01 [Anthostomella pinea]|uniref:Uu.00g058980.m01.CDS01 n=1 Tax=Anthostomella pinea TaxID=933095 RepID=A0AAI8VS15_9PEZI|nr:Uu.00g058980.m01.CDS01 [Anthostomella pinea]